MTRLSTLLSSRFTRERASWRPAEPPVRPRRPPTVVGVEDAYLSEVRAGRLATIYRLKRWFSGAVYDHENNLVRASQKVLGDPRGTRAAADEDRTTRRPDAEHLDGMWLYGGSWASVFGHFLVETLTTLWPRLDEAPVGLVFHANFVPFLVEDWQLQFIDLAGWGGLPIRIIGSDVPVTVDQLVVPGRSVSLHAWAHPQARLVWERIAEGSRGEGGGARVHISRARLNEERRRESHRREIRTTAQQDSDLDRVFADHGFDVVHPQELDVASQLRAVASAEVIAGLSGSGLHQSAFIPPGGRVLEVGDGRTSDRPVRMQVAIDAAMDHKRCFIPGGVSATEMANRLVQLGL